MLSLIVCNKELTPLGSIGVLSIIWETVKQNTQSYAQTGTHTKTSMHVTHGAARNVSRSVKVSFHLRTVVSARQTDTG